MDADDMLDVCGSILNDLSDVSVAPPCSVGVFDGVVLLLISLSENIRVVKSLVASGLWGLVWGRTAQALGLLGNTNVAWEIISVQGLLAFCELVTKV